MSGCRQVVLGCSLLLLLSGCGDVLPRQEQQSEHETGLLLSVAAKARSILRSSRPWRKRQRQIVVLVPSRFLGLPFLQMEVADDPPVQVQRYHRLDEAMAGLHRGQADFVLAGTYTALVGWGFRPVPIGVGVSGGTSLVGMASAGAPDGRPVAAPQPVSDENAQLQLLLEDRPPEGAQAFPAGPAWRKA